MSTEEIVFAGFLVFICIAAPVVYWIGKREEEEDEKYFKEQFKKQNKK
jgi:hypothetical protein